MKHYLSGVFFIATFIMINACTSENSVVDSAAVATASMSAEIHVSYTGLQVVTVETMLRDGPINSDTDVNLVSGDTLKVSTLGDPSNLHYTDNLYDRLLEVSDQVKTMEQGSRRVFDRYVSGIWYYATIDAKYRNKEFTVAFFRDKQNDAPHSVISLPPDFSVSIDELQFSTILSRSAPMTVRWTPANPGYSMEFSVFVNCSNGSSGEWNSGTYVNQAPNALDNYQIPISAYSGYTGDCIVTIGVESSKLNVADPAFRAGSFIQSHQYRTVAVATTN